MSNAISLSAPGCLRPRLITRLITGLSMIILGSAFASEYWGGLVPCHLCWLQRYPYMATIALGILAMILQRRNPGGKAWRACLAISGIAFGLGACIAAYHVGVEQHWWKGPESCTSTIDTAASMEQLMQTLINTPVVRCDEAQWSLFGISMAGYNFLASIGLMLISFSVIPELRRNTRC